MVELTVDWLYALFLPCNSWKGAQLDAQDIDGRTALMQALMNAQTDAVKVLLAAGQ